MYYVLCMVNIHSIIASTLKAVTFTVIKLSVPQRNLGPSVNVAALINLECWGLFAYI